MQCPISYSLVKHTEMHTAKVILIRQESGKQRRVLSKANSRSMTACCLGLRCQVRSHGWTGRLLKCIQENPMSPSWRGWSWRTWLQPARNSQKAEWGSAASELQMKLSQRGLRQGCLVSIHLTRSSAHRPSQRRKNERGR